MARFRAAQRRHRNGDHAPLLIVEDVHKAYGPTPVLQGLSLQLQPGTILGLVGGNGAGKTTLLRLVAALGQPDRGYIVVAGHDTVRGAEAVRRQVGVLFHHTHLYEDLTPTENLRFWGTMSGHRLDTDLLSAILARLALTPYAHQRVRTLSHGTKKRIAMARLMLGQAPLLLLDEPYSGMDPLAIAAGDEFLAAHRRRGGGVLLVSHDLPALHRVCDRLAVLVNGRIGLTVAPNDSSTAQIQAEVGAAYTKEQQ